MYRYPYPSFLIGVFLVVILANSACESYGGSSLATSSNTPQSTSTQPITGKPTVQLRNDAKLGAILADAAGYTLYRYDRDGKAMSNCSGSCAQNWPPLRPASGEPKASSDLQGELESFSRSDDGQQQLMYNGTPLYRFAGDRQPGDTKGDGQGGVWHVVHPEGYSQASIPTSSPSYSTDY